MDPLTIVAALSKLVPEVLHLFGHDTAANTASKVVQIAQQVTGAASPDGALQAIEADPAKALEFRKAVLDHETQLAQIAAQKEKDEAAADIEATRALTERIADLEGTAADLKAVPYFGQVILFARGAQRPLIGYGVMALDYMVFSAAWNLKEGVMQNLFFFINVLVLAFLFGERAVKNIAPLITDMLAAKAGKI